MPRPNFGLVIGAAISLAGIAGYALIIANDDKHQVRIVKPLAEYRCSDDCTRDGGYSWAESEGVENAEDCPDSSSAFWQGCVARARDAKSAIPFNG